MVDLTAFGIQPGTGWQIMGGFATLAIVLFLFVIFAIVLFVVIRIMMFRKKAVCYPVYGDVSSIDKEGNIKANVAVGQPKSRRARFFTKAGVTRMSIMSPSKKTMPIAPDYIYHEGTVDIVYFAVFGNAYIPIKRPTLNTEKHIVLDIHDIEAWKEWANLEIEHLNRRLPEKDVQIRIFALFIVAVVCITVLVGFVLWLSYRNTDKVIGKIDNLGNFISATAQSVGGNVPK